MSKLKFFASGDTEMMQEVKALKSPSARSHTNLLSKQAQRRSEETVRCGNTTLLLPATACVLAGSQTRARVKRAWI